MGNYANGRTLRERLLSRLIIDPSGCVLWTGTIDRDGYGKISVDGRQQLVHRVMYQMFEEPIPDGLELDHVKDRGCTNRHCASIAHLEPVTPLENQRRGEGTVAVNAVKTHCDSGHEFDLFNTYVAPDGERGCRACNRGAAARYKARKRSQPSRKENRP